MNELQNIYSIQNKIDELELLLFLPKNITLTNMEQIGGADSDELLRDLCNENITNGAVLYDKSNNTNLQVTIKDKVKNKTSYNDSCNYYAKGSFTVVYIVSINDDPNEYILRVNYTDNNFGYDKYIKDAKLGIKKYLPKYLYYGELHLEAGLDFGEKKVAYTIGRKYNRVEQASFNSIVDKITFINNLIDFLTVIEDSEPKNKWIINDLKSSNIAIGDNFTPIIVDYDATTIDTKVHTHSFTIYKDEKYKGSKSMADGFVEIFIKVFFGEDLFSLSAIFRNLKDSNNKIERYHTTNYKKIKEYFSKKFEKNGNDDNKRKVEIWANKIINQPDQSKEEYTGLWSDNPIEFKEFKLQ